MSTAETITLAADVEEEVAAAEIAEAVSARHSIARKYVMWIRRRHQDATPAEVIEMLERQYTTAITTAGAVISAGVIAADIGIAMIPVAGAAAAGVKSAGAQAAKRGGAAAAKAAARSAAKAAAKNLALGAAKTGAQKIASLLPAGDEQLQFEITAIFGLALADIHDKSFDQDQAHALVYGLSNGRVSQQQIATMAADLASADDPDRVVGVGKDIAAGRGDWSHWADTLADALPAGGAQSLVRTIQTGQLNDVRLGIGAGGQAAVEYGVGAMVGGITRFVFGREVVEASRIAFPPPPDTFPPQFDIPDEWDDDDDEPNRALAALEDAAKATGDWFADASEFVGDGIVVAATTVSMPFRSVDIDGDGVADEARALTAAKKLGAGVATAASSVGGGLKKLFRRNDQA